MTPGRLLARGAVLLAVALVAMSAGVLLTDQRLGQALAGTDPTTSLNPLPGLTISSPSRTGPAPTSNPAPAGTDCDPRHSALLATHRAAPRIVIRWGIGQEASGGDGRLQRFAVPYPQVAAGLPAPVLARVNAAIRAALPAELHLKETADVPADLLTDVGHVHLDDAQDGLLSGDFEVVRPAANHSATRSFAVSLSDGSAVPLQSLFPAGAACAMRLCDRVRAGISTQLGPDLTLPEPGAGRYPGCPWLGFDTDERFTADYLARPDRLEIVYSPCGVGICARGQVRVPVPYGEI